MSAHSHVTFRDWQDMSDAFNSSACPTRDVLDHITGRWSILILTGLAHGSRRFSELHRMIEGISEKMLAQTLRTLVRDGLITRTVEPAAAPRVDYALTPLGEELTVALRPFLDWMYRRTADVAIARNHHDRGGTPCAR